MLLDNVWEAPSWLAACTGIPQLTRIFFFLLGLCLGLPWPSGAWDCLSVWEKCWNSFSGQYACLWEWWHRGIACILLSVECSKHWRQWLLSRWTHLSFCQLIDDVLDFTSCSDQMGKPTSADLKLGIATGPVLFACQQVGLTLFETFLRRPMRLPVSQAHLVKCEIKTWRHLDKGP